MARTSARSRHVQLQPARRTAVRGRVRIRRLLLKALAATARRTRLTRTGGPAAPDPVPETLADPTEAVDSEPIAAIYSQTSGHLTPDGGHFACGLRRLRAVAGFRTARG